MADPWNSAWEEAEASAPPDVIVYPTLELLHPAFIEGSPAQEVAIRIVSGPADDMQFTLESGAPLNPGETVTFQAIPFNSERPEFVEGRAPESQVTIDNVAREMVPHLEAAVQIKADLTVLFREFRSDDTTEPCYGPIEFKMRKVTLNGTTLSGVAKLDDLANRKFPWRVYRIGEFPGLL